MELRIRTAILDDLPAALELYADARRFMAENGNPDQWGASNYPPESMLRDDVAQQTLYVAFDANSTDDTDMLAVFCFAVIDDETYHKIDGAWLNDEPYGVVHRIATKLGSRGAGRACMQWCINKAATDGLGGGIRIDTHEANKPMQGLVKKLGFTTCGTIWTYDGSPRIAFQLLS